MGQGMLKEYFERKAYGKALCRKIDGCALYKALETCRTCDIQKGCKGWEEGLARLTPTDLKRLES